MKVNGEKARKPWKSDEKPWQTHDLATNVGENCHEVTFVSFACLAAVAR